MTGTFAYEESAITLPHVGCTHPMDSGRLLLGLLAISEESSDRDVGVDAELIDGVISRDVARRLITALHHRDPGIVRHSRRVATISIGIARSLGWDDRQLMRLELAALMHDLGKVGIPDQILLKPGRFSEEEAEIAEIYHRVGVSVLQACGADGELLQICSQLHTHFNGASEDFQRIGSDVHQGARILAVADAYDALTSVRPHRPAFSHTESMNQLLEQSGTRFDGNVVNALMRWFELEGHAQIVPEPPDEVTRNERKNLCSEEAFEAYFFANLFVYLHILERTYDAYYVVDNRGICRVWSKGAENLFGVPAEAVIGQPWTIAMVRFTDPADGRQLATGECPAQQVLQDGLPRLTSVRLVTDESQGTFDDIEVQSLPLNSSVGQIGGVIEIVRNLTGGGDKSGQYQELKMAATRDPLTSVANRGQLERQLVQFMEEARRQNGDHPLSIIFLDVDHFKSINDTHGHAVGDKVLIELARFLQHETYSGELVGRYGGEEFVLLCPETDLEHAVRRADRLRTGLANETIADTLRITSSFGVAQMTPDDSPESLLDRADMALLEAKQTGRNRVCWDGVRYDEETTNSEVEEAVESSADKSLVRKDDGSLEYVSQFEVLMASSMLLYKLRGFVDELDAQVLENDEKHICLQIGQKPGMFSSWEKTRPVKLVLDLAKYAPDERAKPDKSRRDAIEVRITPIGKVKEEETFSEYGFALVRALKSFVCAD